MADGFVRFFFDEKCSSPCNGNQAVIAASPVLNLLIHLDYPIERYKSI